MSTVDVAPCPPLQTVRSAVGRHAVFGGVEEEVMRVLHTQRNFYMVLKVTRSTPKRDIKLNYHTIIKLLGEAAAGELEGITEARSIVHHAFHTVANPLKRQLYNQYLEEPHMSIGDNETYAEWEGRQADSTPPVPALANRLLRIRGGGLILMCICFPLTLVILIVLALLALITLPFRLCYAHSCAPSKELDDAERRGAASRHRDTRGQGAGRTEEPPMGQNFAAMRLDSAMVDARV